MVIIRNKHNTVEISKHKEIKVTDEDSRATYQFTSTNEVDKLIYWLRQIRDSIECDGKC